MAEFAGAGASGGGEEAGDAVRGSPLPGPPAGKGGGEGGRAAKWLKDVSSERSHAGRVAEVGLVEDPEEEMEEQADGSDSDFDWDEMQQEMERSLPLSHIFSLALSLLISDCRKRPWHLHGRLRLDLVH